MRINSFTNQQILEIIRKQLGGIQNFLLQFSIIQLQEAIKQKRNIEDQKVLNDRSANQYKQNVLNLTLKQVIHRCKAEGLINYFNHILHQKSSRIQNHPQFGRMLVRGKPQKYFIGTKSTHHNRAKQIERAYDIYSHSFSNQQNSDQPQEKHQNQQQSPNQQEIYQDMNDFVVNDYQVEQSYYSESEFHNKNRKAKKTKNIKKQLKIVSKNQTNNSKKVLKKIIIKNEKEQYNPGQYFLYKSQQSSSQKLESLKQYGNIQITTIKRKRNKMTVESDEDKE